MKLKEKFAKAGLSCDQKARRRVNVSNERANISAERLESGVTIEELEEIGVPVYRYETQVTIHGKLPNIDVTRINGYKSLMLNGNGSIGVRYVAIDAEKKRFIKKACTALKSNFRGSFNSKGFTLFTSASDKESILKAYQSFPRDLIHGSIYAGALMYGGFGLFVEVGSVDAENLEALLVHLTGKGESDCQLAIQNAEAEAEARAQAYKTEAEKRSNERLEARKALESRLALALAGREPVKSFEAGKYEIAVGFDESGKVKYKSIEFAKRGPVFCCKRAGDLKFTKYNGQFDKALGKRAFRVETPKPKPKPKREGEHLLDEIKGACDWQGVEVYVTNAGKPKEMASGIPSAGFWMLWKHSKAEIKKLGFTIYAEKVEPTGQFRTVRGKSFEIKRRQWLVQCWKPALLGYKEPTVEKENMPF